MPKRTCTLLAALLGVLFLFGIHSGHAAALPEFKVPNPERGSAIGLGGPIAVSGDTLMAYGGYLSNGNRTMRFYRADDSGNWEFEDEIRPPAPTRPWDFGEKVALSGDIAAVSDSQTSGGLTIRKCVSVFTRAGTAWTRSATIEEEATRMAFMDGRLVIWSASGATASIYGQTPEGWTLNLRLVPFASTPGRAFSVAVGEGLAAAVDSTSLRIFHIGPGDAVERQRLQIPGASNRSSNDLGGSVIAGGDILTAWQDQGEATPSLYIFAKGAEVWSYRQTLPLPAVALTDTMVSSGAMVGMACTDGSVLVLERIAGHWSRTTVVAPGETVSTSSLAGRIAVENEALYVARNTTSALASVIEVYRRGAEGWKLESSISNLRRGGDDRFGYWTAVSGSRAAIVAAHEDPIEGRTPLMHMLEKEGASWRIVQEIPLGGGPWLPLGDMAMLGDTLAMVMPLDNGASVTIYERRGGTWSAVLDRVETFSPENDAAFVGLSETYVAVGVAPGEGVAIYRREPDSWHRQEVLHAPRAGTWGAGVAMSGSALVATGSAGTHVFRLRGQGWVHEQELLLPGGVPPPADSLIAIDGDVIALGAHYTAPAKGFYIFVRSEAGWTCGANGQPFINTEDQASSVVLSGNLLVVGSGLSLRWPYADPRSWIRGRVDLHRRTGTGWTLERTIQPSDERGSSFGDSTGFDGRTIIVGAPYDDDSGWSSGSVYFYDYPSTADGWLVE